MSELIMRGGFPVGWRRELIAHSSGIVAAGTLIWAAPGIVAVRNVVMAEDDSDPITAVAGATTVRLGFNGGTNIFDLFASATVGQLNTGQVAGWGIRGAKNPGGTNSPNPNGDGGVLVMPQGSIDGTSPNDGTRDGIFGSTDAGSVTGTLFLLFEWRPL